MEGGGENTFFGRVLALGFLYKLEKKKFKKTREVGQI